MPRLKLDKSHALYERALKSIPLASQTFSKSAMQHVFGASPLFLDRGRGALVWDVDGNEYVDYILGLLPVVLGYADPDVDAAIRAQLDRGISFSLATELEVELAERLVRIIPCAEMVRFAKNGSDVTSAAIRLARASTGRERVILCGYHGWHDWYIGTTTRHLGVPEAVRNLSVTVPFNALDPVADMLRKDPSGVAAIILEPAGATPPAPGYLEGLRALADQYGVVLVFDEIVTGFRIDLGGAQKYYGVTPDLACFGKAMGNGMPISAIVGRRGIMRWMEDIFFSGTFGGEALSLAAGIATIDKLERENVVPRLHAAGARIAEAVGTALKERGLHERFSVGGPAWWPRLVLREGGETPAAIVTSLLRQELVANGVLIGPTFNLCLAHDDRAVLQRTVSGVRGAFASLASALAAKDPSSHLRGKPIEPVFKVRA